MIFNLTWRSAARLIVPATGVAAIAVVAFLFEWQPNAYRALFAFLGVETGPIPFADLQYTLAAVECAKRGIDVYVGDPCDLFRQAFNYSPLWLHATFLPDTSWSNSLGLGLAALFFLSLGLLPSVTRPTPMTVTIAAALSPPVAFAVERGNMDLVIFIAVTIAVDLLRRSRPLQLSGYALIFLAGALKFYPVTLLVLALREPMARFLIILGLAAAAVIGSAVYYHDELFRLAANLPRMIAFSNVFGASDLPDGIAAMIFADPSTGMARATKFALYAMLLSRLGVGVVRLFRSRFRDALRKLPERELLYLVAGAVLIAGCFFAGRSVGYREIFLLLTLPALLRLAATEGCALRTYLLVIAVLWMGIVTWGGLIPRFAAAIFGDAAEQRIYSVLWLISELLWWELVTTLVAVVVCVGADWLHLGNNLREK